MSHRRLPPLTALRAFEAAARHLSFTAAADELNVTQGAVSRQVRLLEDRMGVALFERFNRRVALTPAGTALLSPLSRALDIMAEGVERAAPGTMGRAPLRVSCLGTLAMRWLIPRLPRFQERHPTIEVALSTSDAALDPGAGPCDLAIRNGVPPWPAGYAVTPLFGERIGPVGAPSLFAGGVPVSAEGMRRLPRLHTETRTEAWADWARLAGAAGFDRRDGPMFEHFYFMLEAAVAGLGVAVAPRVLVEDDLAAGRLEAPLGFVDSGLSYYLATPAARADPRAARFRDWVLEETAQPADVGGGVPGRG